MCLIKKWNELHVHTSHRVFADIQKCRTYCFVLFFAERFASLRHPFASSLPLSRSWHLQHWIIGLQIWMPLVLLNKTKVCFARFKLPSRVADKLTKYKHNAINHKHCYSIKGSLLSVQCVTDLRIGAFLNLIQRKLPLFCPRTGLRVLTITVIGIETIVHPTTLIFQHGLRTYWKQ